MRYSKKIDSFLFAEEDIPLETVILLVGGMALTITGGLLFPVAAGRLPYYENGLFGLLLIVFALQTITLGKTPFGDMRRSKALLFFGVAIASLGIVTCFIPGIFGPLPRMLLFFCFGLGGVVQLVRAYLDETGMRAWMRYGGIFRHLVFACSGVYGLSMLAGLLLWTQPPLSAPITATVMLLFGCAVIYLGGVLRLVYRACPEADPSLSDRSGFSFDHSMLLLTGVFMILLGVLLIPVSLGLLPFSGSAQLGLLMIIFAIQMLAAGNTPIGLSLPRSWPVLGSGSLFAALGIVSCVIPDILVAPLTLLVGVLNILSGFISLGKRLLPSARTGDASAAPDHPLLRKLSRTQLALDLLSIMFGASMLVPGIIPGLVVGVVLAANGGVLLYLLHLLVAIMALAAEMLKAPQHSV
ncbi:MAG: hypothetical protein RIN56_18695 [Sporomusaceae bacterium]|nr:hypothetical protein [Sporomusaceae bacterium]